MTTKWNEISIEDAEDRAKGYIEDQSMAIARLLSEDDKVEIDNLDGSYTDVPYVEWNFVQAAYVLDLYSDHRTDEEATLDKNKDIIKSFVKLAVMAYHNAVQHYYGKILESITESWNDSYADEEDEQKKLDLADKLVREHY